jgi:hypothetical protein
MLVTRNGTNIEIDRKYKNRRLGYCAHYKTAGTYPIFLMCISNKNPED